MRTPSEVVIFGPMNAATTRVVFLVVACMLIFALSFAFPSPPKSMMDELLETPSSGACTFSFDD